MMAVARHWSEACHFPPCRKINGTT